MSVYSAVKGEIRDVASVIVAPAEKVARWTFGSFLRSFFPSLQPKAPGESSSNAPTPIRAVRKGAPVKPAPAPATTTAGKDGAPSAESWARRPGQQQAASSAPAIGDFPAVGLTVTGRPWSPPASSDAATDLWTDALPATVQSGRVAPASDAVIAALPVRRPRRPPLREDGLIVEVYGPSGEIL